MLLFQVIVLLIGTNNHAHTAEQVVGGIVEIVSTLQQKQPQSHVVVMVMSLILLRYNLNFKSITLLLFLYALNLVNRIVFNCTSKIQRSVHVVKCL